MISPEFVAIIITAGTGLFTGGIAWNRINNKIDDHIEWDLRIEKDLKSQLSKLWEWKDFYEKDVSDKRLEIQKQFGALEGRVSVHDGNYQQILSILKEIKDEIKDLRDRK